MASVSVDAASLQPRWGTFRFIRAELGGTAFGLNQIDFPPDKVGGMHDETESGQEEEIYYCISGSGSLEIDGETVDLVPGRYILVSPDARRQPTAGPNGMSLHLRRRGPRRHLRALDSPGRVAGRSARTVSAVRDCARRTGRSRAALRGDA